MLTKSSLVTPCLMAALNEKHEFAFPHLNQYFLFLDLTDSSSFLRAKFWVKELQNCEEVSLSDVNLCITNFQL